MDGMWQPLKNLVGSLQTYRVLSPDLAVRQQVNSWLANRPCLGAEEWFVVHWTPPAVAAAYPATLVQFLYLHLEQCSGLTIGRLRPQDRLLEDLKFPLVCWFDWGLTLCDEFYTCFGVDLTDCFDETQFHTLSDLMGFLGRQLPEES